MNLSKEDKEMLRKAERIAKNPKKPVLDRNAQLELFAQSRLYLYLVAPANAYDDEELETLRKHQTKRIEQFVHLLHETLVNERGRCLITVHSCE
jgi:hypothetical protein